jgi:hypothetical protein
MNAQSCLLCPLRNKIVCSWQPPFYITQESQKYRILQIMQIHIKSIRYSRPSNFIEEIGAVRYKRLSFLNSYLSNRSQKCQINGFLSSEKVIRCGVPQGSILGPLFFLLYINDLPQCLSKTKPRLFADDTNLTASGDSKLVLKLQ